MQTEPAISIVASSPSSDLQRRRSFGFALQVAGELGQAVEVLRRAMDVAVVELGGGAEGPHRVNQVRAGQRHEIGAAGGEDRVRMIGLVDVADSHGRELSLVADL